MKKGETNKNKEIVEKAIRKAINNGYTAPWIDFDNWSIFEHIDAKGGIFLDCADCDWFELIFDHYFAKAIWGEEIIEVDSHRLENGWDEDGFWEKPAPLMMK